MKDIAEQIEARFNELGVKIEVGEIETRLEQLIHKFKVQPEEAKRNVINYFLKQHNISKMDFFASHETEEVKISDIKEDKKWVTLNAKVVQLWSPNSNSISQVGLLGDETGTIKFVKWERSSLPSVEEGMCYTFKNVTTSQWQGNFSVGLNNKTEIIPLNEDIEVNFNTIEFIGAIVDIQSGSGLIKRCPECNRALLKGTCGEHGKIEGTYDLRIKAVMDNGEKVQNILLNRELTETLTGITLNEAKKIATEALDHSVVLEEMKIKIIGRYFIVKGSKVENVLLVESIEQSIKPLNDEIKKILSELEA